MKDLLKICDRLKYYEPWQSSTMSYLWESFFFIHIDFYMHNKNNYHVILFFFQLVLFSKLLDKVLIKGFFGGKNTI